MAIQIAIGGDLQVATSGSDWATVECTNGAAVGMDWQAEIETDGDGFATIAGVVTSPHEQGFYLRWNASPSDYRLVCICISGGGSSVYALSNVTTGRLITNSGVDWLNLESTHKCRIVEIRFFTPPTGQGRFTHASASPTTGSDYDDRMAQIFEWIHANLNQRNVPVTLHGSSGGADAVLAPFLQDSPMARRVFYLGIHSMAQPFWDLYRSCQFTTPGTTRVNVLTGDLTSNPADDGPLDHPGYGIIEYILRDDRCETQTITELDSEPYSDRILLAPLTPAWWQGTIHCTIGTGGIGDSDLNGNAWATGNLFHDAFFDQSRRVWFHSASDGHGDALSDIFSDGFAEVHAELAALADGGGLAMVSYNKFQDFVEQLLTAIHNATAAGHVFKVYLSNATPSASGDAVKADLAEISAGSGYTAGGTDVQNTLSETSGTATVGATDVTWTASGGTIGPFQYVVLYNDTSASDNLIAWWDYGSALTLNDGESFTVDFGSNQLFTLA